MTIVTLQISTRSHSTFVEITKQVRDIVREHDVQEGLVVVFVPHTTAGVTLNENADPNVRQDMQADFDRLMPADQAYYRHFEGNSASHLRTSVVGNSLTILIEGGDLILGTWQGIYLCEFDGPRARKVHLKITSDIE